MNEDYTSDEVSKIGDFIWEKNGSLLNYGVIELFKILMENKNHIDHICIFSNNKSMLLCEIAMYIVNNIVGNGINIIDKIYPYRMKYRKTMNKSKKELINTIKFNNPDVAINNNVKILFIDSKTHSINHETGVVSHYVHPSYMNYDGIEELVRFYGQLKGNSKEEIENDVDYFGDMKDKLKEKNHIDDYSKIFNKDYYDEVIEAGNKFIDKISGGGRRRKSRRIKRKITRKGRKNGKKTRKSYRK
jgi:hypothetical protein